jgi:hypothetical protein
MRKKDKSTQKQSQEKPSLSKKVYLNCRTLPMRLLVEVFNTGDLRHLLKEYDESIANTELMPYFDSLMSEYSNLSGNGEYEHHLQKIDSVEWKKQVINACNLCVIALSPPFFNKEEAQKLIDSYNLRIKLTDKIVQKESIKKLEDKIKQIITSLKINYINDQEQNSKESNITWEKLRVNIQAELNILPEYDCTVTMYIEYNARKEALIAARKQNNG